MTSVRQNPKPMNARRYTKSMLQMRPFFILPLLVSILDSKAEFNGIYSLNPPTNGTYQVGAPGSRSFGNWQFWAGAGLATADTTLAPASVGISAVNSHGYLQVPAAESGQISLTYQVSGTNIGTFYWFYYDPNDRRVETDITDLVLTATQVSFPGFAGHFFGFGVM